MLLVSPKRKRNSLPPRRRGSQHGKVSRRKFLQFCSLMAGTLALPQLYTHRIAKALAAPARLPVIWLAGQDCTGDTESLLRSFDPTFTDLIFDILSLDYHETLMVPAGYASEKSLDDTLNAYNGQFICVVEGAIPLGNAAYCTIAGESFLNLVRRVAPQAKVNIAAGSCSVDGGIVAAAPNPTGATGLQGAVPGVPNLVNLPGCPMNGVNLVAVIVHYLTFGQLPALDSSRRPLFAYGNEIHDENRCERYRFYEAKQFVRRWDDEGHRKGWCLKYMGCKGPNTKANCYTRNWNETSWPIGSGAICIGCTRSRFWDRGSFFR